MPLDLCSEDKSGSRSQAGGLQRCKAFPHATFAELSPSFCSGTGTRKSGPTTRTLRMMWRFRLRQCCKNNWPGLSERRLCYFALKDHALRLQRRVFLSAVRLQRDGESAGHRSNQKNDATVAMRAPGRRIGSCETCCPCIGSGTRDCSRQELELCWQPVLLPKCRRR